MYVCVPAGEVGQEGVGEGAGSCTPGSLHSCTHQHHPSGLEGHCSCAKVPEVGNSNCKCLALLCCVLASAQVLCPADIHLSLFSTVLVGSNRHLLVTASALLQQLACAIHLETCHMLVKAVGDVNQSGNQYVLLRTLTLVMNT